MSTQLRPLLRTAALVSACCLGLGACSTTQESAGTRVAANRADAKAAPARPAPPHSGTTAAVRPAPVPALDSNVATSGMPDRVSAARLLGQEVVSADGERIGDIDDVILDRSGTAREAVIGASGGAIAVALGDLRRSANQGDQWVLSGTSAAQVAKLQRFHYDQNEVSLRRQEAPAKAEHAPAPLLMP